MARTAQRFLCIKKVWDLITTPHMSNGKLQGAGGQDSPITLHLQIFAKLLEMFQCALSGKSFRSWF